MNLPGIASISIAALLGTVATVTPVATVATFVAFAGPAGCVAVVGNTVERTNHLQACSSIVHVVLIELASPADAEALQDDCWKQLPRCRGVINFDCGPHVEMGRANVDAAYTIGVMVTFADRAGYDAYLADEHHKQLVQAWQPKWKSCRIFDFGNPPAPPKP